MATNRENDEGHRDRHRHTARVTAVTAARVTGPGQPSHRQAKNAATAARSATGCRRMKPVNASSSRQAWTRVMIQPGVRSTGDRQAGAANGSWLWTWAGCSRENVDILIGPASVPSGA